MAHRHIDHITLEGVFICADLEGNLNGVLCETREKEIGSAQPIWQPRDLYIYCL